MLNEFGYNDTEYLPLIIDTRFYLDSVGREISDHFRILVQYLMTNIPGSVIGMTWLLGSMNIDRISELINAIYLH